LVQDCDSTVAKNIYLEVNKSIVYYKVSPCLLLNIFEIYWYLDQVLHISTPPGYSLLSLLTPVLCLFHTREYATLTVELAKMVRKKLSFSPKLGTLFSKWAIFSQKNCSFWEKDPSFGKKDRFFKNKSRYILLCGWKIFIHIYIFPHYL